MVCGGLQRTCHSQAGVVTCVAAARAVLARWLSGIGDILREEGCSSSCDQSTLQGWDLLQSISPHNGFCFHVIEWI